jgi:phosphonate transport system substrate-binding protein
MPVRAPRLAVLLGVLGLAMLVITAASCGEGKTKIVIAVQPTSTAEELSAEASEIEDFLEARVDADVEVLFPTTYAGVIEALRFGTADAAFMGAWPAALAAQEADAEVVLAEVRAVTIGDDNVEAPYYFSYWVVEPDSPYRSLADLEGEDVAFPSQLSTSGYVAPTAKLVELGLIDAEGDDPADPDDFFGDVFFAGGYAQGWEALQAGQVDATVIAGDVPEELYREVLANTRVIAEQGPVPSHSVVFSQDFEDPLRSELLTALEELGRPEYRELMRTFVSGIFVSFQATTTEEHLGSLNEFLEATNLAFSESPPASSQPTPEADPEPDADPEPEGS